jgi:hypothetical protein
MIDKRGNDRKLLRYHRLKTLALSLACAHELIEHAGKACQQCMVERGFSFLALLRLSRFDYASHREQRVEARRLEIGQSLRPLGDGLRLCQRRLVQTNLGLPGFAPDAEV